MWIALFIAGLSVPLAVAALTRKRRLPVTVTVDADAPRPKDVAGYLAEIAVRLDERPERMRVVFDAPPGIELDLEPDGRLAVRVEGRRAYRLDLRRRWIADHPVPLPLGSSGPVLYIDPVDKGRFRVSDRRPGHVPRAAAWILCLVAIAAAIMFSPELLVTAVGGACGCAWLTWQGSSA